MNKRKKRIQNALSDLQFFQHMPMTKRREQVLMQKEPRIITLRCYTVKQSARKTKKIKQLNKSNGRNNRKSANLLLKFTISTSPGAKGLK